MLHDDDAARVEVLHDLLTGRLPHRVVPTAARQMEPPPRAYTRCLVRVRGCCRAYSIGACVASHSERGMRSTLSRVICSTSHSLRPSYPDTTAYRPPSGISTTIAA
jgi:hypothetical protein